jgi:hypothetical protein
MLMSIDLLLNLVGDWTVFSIQVSNTEGDIDRVET